MLFKSTSLLRTFFSSYYGPSSFARTHTASSSSPTTIRFVLQSQIRTRTPTVALPTAPRNTIRMPDHARCHGHGTPVIALSSCLRAWSSWFSRDAQPECPADKSLAEDCTRVGSPDVDPLFPQSLSRPDRARRASLASALVSAPSSSRLATSVLFSPWQKLGRCRRDGRCVRGSLLGRCKGSGALLSSRGCLGGRQAATKNHEDRNAVRF